MGGGVLRKDGRRGVYGGRGMEGGVLRNDGRTGVEGGE